MFDYNTLSHCSTLSETTGENALFAFLELINLKLYSVLYMLYYNYEIHAN